MAGEKGSKKQQQRYTAMADPEAPPLPHEEESKKQQRHTAMADLEAPLAMAGEEGSKKQQRHTAMADLEAPHAMAGEEGSKKQQRHTAMADLEAPCLPLPLPLPPPSPSPAKDLPLLLPSYLSPSAPPLPSAPPSLPQPHKPSEHHHHHHPRTSSPPKKQVPFPGKTKPGAMHHIFKEAMPESIRLITIILRFLALAFTFISLTVMAANSHTISNTSRNEGHFQVRGEIDRFLSKRRPHLSSTSHSTSTSRIGFNNFSTYKYLLSVGVITCFYSLMQLLSAAYCHLTSNSSSFPVPLNHYLSFIFDQVCSYLLLSSSSASFSLSQALISSQGPLHGLGILISQANISASFGFLAFSVVCASSMISGYHVVLYLIS